MTKKANANAIIIILVDVLFLEKIRNEIKFTTKQHNPMEIYRNIKAYEFGLVSLINIGATTATTNKETINDTRQMKNEIRMSLIN